MRAKKSQAVWIGMSIAVLLAFATLAVCYVAGVLFLLANKTDPTRAGIFSIFHYWQWYADDPVLLSKLRGSVGVAALAGFVIAPAALASSLRKRRSLHGDARFATGTELRKSGLLAADGGILLGRWGRKYISLPGQSFLMLCAPTRSGKGVAIVISNLLNWPDSVVAVDIKRENFEITSGYRAKCGQEVHLFAPFDEEGRTSRFNPLSYIRVDPMHRVGDILSIATILYPTDSVNAGSTEAFFNDQARNLFLGLALLLLETPELPRTIGEMIRQASGKRKAVKDHLTDLVHSRHAQGQPLSDDCVDALMRFLSNSENTLASILASFNAPLTVFADPRVDAATSGDDFLLTDLRRRHLSIYLHVPPNRLAQGSLLLNLFFSILIDQNTRELPALNPRLRHSCLLVLDEFPALGRIVVLEKAVGFIAGYGLRLLTITQSNAMLSATYGRAAARNLTTNHTARIFFAPQELEDAREYSETLGYLTERRESRSQSHSAGRSGASSVSHSEERRALMLPQELREMDPDKEVILLQGIKPIYTDKIRYFEDPSFATRLLPPPKVPKIDLALHQAQIAERPRQTTDAVPPTAPAADRSEQAREDWTQTGELPEDRPIAELADEFFASLHLGKDSRSNVPEFQSDPGAENRPRRAGNAAPQRKPRQR